MKFFSRKKGSNSSRSGETDKMSFDNVIDALEENDQLIIFKASSRCYVSHYVESRFDEWYNENMSDKLKVFKIMVIEQRPLSNFIAEKYKIAHESPQLIWLDHNENILWHGSHGSITTDTLDELLRTHSK